MAGVPITAKQISRDRSKRTSKILKKAFGVSKTGANLRDSAKRLYGSWGSALAASDIQPNKIRYRFWTDKMIFKAIHALSNQGVRINSNQIGQDNSKRTAEILFKTVGKKTTGMALQVAGKKQFGTWNKCLHESGIDPKKIKYEDFWTDEKFRQAVLALRKNSVCLRHKSIENNNDPNVTRILEKALGEKKTGNNLYLAAKYHLKTWDNALRLANINPSQYRLQGDAFHSTKDKIIETLNLLKENGIPLYRATVYKSKSISSLTSRKIGRVISGCSLVSAAQREFGSWDKALIYANFNPIEVRRLNRKKPISRRRKINLPIVPHQVETVIDQDGNSRRITFLGTPGKMPDEIIAEAEFIRCLQKIVKSFPNSRQSTVNCILDVIFNIDDSFDQVEILTQTKSRLGTTISDEQIEMTFRCLAKNPALIELIRK